MSDTHASYPAGSGPSRAGEPVQATGWVGWVIFAGVAMIVLGAFSIIEGLAAVYRTGVYVSTSSGVVLHSVSYPTWGWVHFGLGVAAVLIGFGVMTGALVARVLGIALAVVSAIINLAFLPAYPVWGIIVIAIDVIVIYALAVHGREMKYV